MKFTITTLIIIFCIVNNGQTNKNYTYTKQPAMNQKHTNQINMDDPFLIEQTEIAAWKDLIDAAPDSFKLVNGLRYRYIGGGLAINFQAEPVPLFNRVIGLGLAGTLTPAVINEIKNFYTHNEKYIIHYSSAVKPVNADSLLKQSGFYLAGSWERIVRDNKPLQDTGDDTSKIEVKQVNEELKERWADFLINTYKFNFYEWPRSFALRKGWRHYIALRNNKIVACRSFYMTSQKTVFRCRCAGTRSDDSGLQSRFCNMEKSYKRLFERECYIVCSRYRITG